MESFSSEGSFNAFNNDSSIIDSSPQNLRGGNKVSNVKCRYYMNNGYCFHGEACQFVHAGHGMNGDLHSPTLQQHQESFYSSEDDGSFISSPSPSTAFLSGSSNVSKVVESSKQTRQYPKQQTNGKGPSMEVLQQQFRRMRLLQQANKVEKESYQQNQDHSTHLPHQKSIQPLQFQGSKTDKTSYFMTQQIRMELLKQRQLTLTESKETGSPESVENYHSLFPMEDVKNPQIHRLLGYASTCYRVTNSKDGLQYCLRRIHGFRLLNPIAVSTVEKWKKLQNSNIVPLKEAFTTKAFGDTSLIFIYQYFPGAETLMGQHFSGHGSRSPPGNDLGSYQSWSTQTNSPTGAYAKQGKPTQKVMPERLIWSYVIQLTAAIRQVHSSGLCCRVIDPSKVLLIGNSRLRLNCAGILDILTSDTDSSGSGMMSHYQQEDLVALGKLILALACYSIEAVQRDSIQQSLEFVTRNYSNDLKSLIWHLLSSQVTSNPHSINEVMPMIGARFYSQLDSTQGRCDLLESELAKELDNGRLLRLLTKLGTILERSEFNMDPEWSETGDRYLLKLFRDYLLHQVTESGSPWIDFAHIVSTLNKLDTGSAERICLSSRDEQSILVVSYHDLKACLETAFSELIQMSEMS